MQLLSNQSAWFTILYCSHVILYIQYDVMRWCMSYKWLIVCLLISVQTQSCLFYFRCIICTDSWIQFVFTSNALNENQILNCHWKMNRIELIDLLILFMLIVCRILRAVLCCILVKVRYSVHKRKQKHFPG